MVYSIFNVEMMLIETRKCLFHAFKWMNARSCNVLFSNVIRRVSSRATLHASPMSGLGDEDLDIRASGLGPGQSVLLRGEVKSDCGRFGFESKAIYNADHNGEISGKFFFLRFGLL